MRRSSFNITIKKPWPLVLGLDVSSKSLKYLLLRRRGKGLRIERFGRYSLENGDTGREERIQQIVHWLFLNANGLKRAKTVVGLDDPGVFIKKESFPSLSKKELHQTIYFGIERELGKEGEAPSLVFDYKALGPDPEKEGNVEYLTMGVAEDVVDDKIRPLVAEGVVPTKVVPPVMAMANLSKLIPELAEKDFVGILDIGAQRSALVFLRRGEMDFFREIVVGGGDFTKVIAGTIFHEGRAIQFTKEEVAEFKLQYGYPLGFSEGMTYQGAPLAEIGAMMRPVVERLTGEIQRSIGFYQDQSGGGELESLYLVGGGARLKHLPEVLMEKIDVPVSLLPVPDGVRVGGSKEQQEAFRHKFLEQAVSFSLALESSGEGDLLPQPYKNIRKTKRIKQSLGYAALCVVGFIALMTFLSLGKVHSMRKRVSEMERRIARSESNTHLFAALLDQKNVLEGELGNLNLRLQQDETVIQVLRLISHAVPNRISLMSLEYGRYRVPSKKGQKKEQEEPRGWVIRIQGGSRKPPNDVGVYLAQFILELEKSGYFSEVKLERDLFIEDGEEYLFELVGYLKNGNQESVE